MKKLAMYGDFLVRIVAGLIFIFAGYGKLFGAPGIEGFTGMLTSIGFPFPGFWAVLVGIVELVGGILLLVGLCNKVSAALLSIVMLVAIITVHIPNGWNDTRFPLLLFTVLIRYIGTPGFMNLEELIKKKK